jgi:hypothetical protein
MFRGKVGQSSTGERDGEPSKGATVGKRTLVEQVESRAEPSAAGAAPASAAGPSPALRRLQLKDVPPGASAKRAATDRAVGQMAKSASGASAAEVAERHETLDGATASRFGDKLGADFTGVQIHHGDGVAEERGATAVTFGGDIHFSKAAVAAGNWKDGLLGHELVHTVQQGAAPAVDGAPARQGDTHTTEAEAEKVGRGAARGEAGRVSLKAPGEAQMFAPSADDPQPAPASRTASTPTRPITMARPRLDGIWSARSRSASPTSPGSRT